MYQDTITVFNRKTSRLGDMWYPTILHNVNLNMDKATIVQTYGESSADNVMLNIAYEVNNGVKTIAGKKYMLPKEWDGQTHEECAQTITFTSGEDFDFFLVGEYPEEPVSDDEYIDGFYNFMNQKYDEVYAITSVGIFSVIPHLEITGK